MRSRNKEEQEQEQDELEIALYTINEDTTIRNPLIESSTGATTTHIIFLASLSETNFTVTKLSKISGTEYFVITGFNPPTNEYPKILYKIIGENVVESVGTYVGQGPYNIESLKIDRH